MNEEKSKVTVALDNVNLSLLNMTLNGENTAVVNSFMYLKSCFSSDRRVKEESMRNILKKRFYTRT